MAGMSPLHTHDASGQIHEESNTIRDFTLQEFLAIWGQRLDSSMVLNHPVDSGHRAQVIVDGAEKQGTLNAVFVNGQNIQIVCGP
jgi:pSer/pThr/pTyr-binding forkhead associated (FHA) protein